MSATQDEIREWLLTQQNWLQEAADRLLKQGELTDTDINELCESIKTQAGQTVSKNRNFDNLVAAPEADSELRLVNVSEVMGIENLAPRQPLTFGAGNLTVIYGHNGSGKSSYARILKKASGKPRATALKPNVFQATPAQSKCKITHLLVGGQPVTTEWQANAQAIDALRAIDIFDSDEAYHYLSKESAATYTPSTVAMFEKLAAACDKIKITLQAEQSQLVSALPAIPQNLVQTQPAQQYKTLSAKIADSAVQQLVSWTDDDARKLNELNERLKVTDPAALAAQKRATKKQVAQIANDLKGGYQAYCAEGLQKIRALQGTAKAKRKIAVEAAQVKSAKLEGVGSDTWRALWEAAKSYSQTAYPEQAFPVTDDSRCVLCQQELAPDAQQRLRDFETFVQSKLEAEAGSAEALYKQALNALPEVPSAIQINTQCEAAGLTNEDWEDYFSNFWKSALQVRNSLMAGEANDPASPVQDVEENVDKLRNHYAELESQAVQHEKDAKDFDRAQAAKDKNTLEAKQWISQQSVAVFHEVTRLKKYQDYENWKRLANSRNISTKSSEIAEKIVTQAYVDRFNQELKQLGATRIKVKLVKTRTERGKVLHQLCLQGAVDGQAMPDSVLSEGERRIIALAAFLADVTAKPIAAPFIFDDPISSLDHDFEWSVAKRLAELAQTRQVLVFTHRLSLYGAMEEVARKIGEEWRTKNLYQHCIESYGGTSGHPANQDASVANTKTANNILITRLDDAKRAGNASGAAAYFALAQGICSDFRKLIERTIEDDMLNQVVRRHRRSIQTDNRLSVLTCISPADCTFFDGLMTKYSCFEHSQSTETPVVIPGEFELRVDLEALKTWRESFKKRPQEGGMHV